MLVAKLVGGKRRFGRESGKLGAREAVFTGCAQHCVIGVFFFEEARTRVDAFLGKSREFVATAVRQ